MKATTLLILGTAIGCSTLAMAAEAPKHHHPAKREIPARVLEKFDTDKDGTLSKDERVAMVSAVQERRKELLAKYDANASGKLDPEEIKAARAAGELRFPMGHRGHRKAGAAAAPAI